MNVNDKYQFFVTVNSVTTQVYPAVDDLQIQWQLQDEEEYYRQSVANGLVFVNNSKRSITDYDYLKAIEDGSDRCDEITIEIKSTCTNPATTLLTGLLVMTKAQWDEDNCTVTIPVTTNDEYTCLIANKDEVVDFSELTSYSVKSFVGEIETAGPFTNDSPTRLGESYIPAGLTGSEWVLIRYTAELISPTTWQETWEFVREKVTGGTQPPGFGWVSEGSDWVRAVIVDLLSSQAFPGTFGTDLDIQYQVRGSDSFEADNGRLLSDIIEKVVDQCGDLTVVSNFFNINPDGTEPANSVYSAANTYLQTLMVWQKSDIKRFDDLNNATKLIISWSDLYENLYNLFNIRIVVDGSTLRIEHLSYFTAANGLDLTTQKNEYLEGTRRYSYEDGAYANVEKFEFMDRVSESFKGFDILYNSSCVDPEASPVNYQATLFTTDLDFCLDFPDDVDDDGFFLANVALYDSELYIQKYTVPGFTALGPQFNGHLAMPNLHEFYWKHGRIFLTGEMNQTATTFESTIPTKAQTPITFKMCCNELLNFNVDELMNSQYGWGKIKTAQYSTKTEALTVELMHS